MKRITLIIIAAAILLAAAVAQTPLPGRKLATLGPEEYIVTDESVLLSGGASGSLADDVFLVTSLYKSGKTTYFTYDKAGRKGPFPKITESMLKRARTEAGPLKFYLETDMSPEGLDMKPDPANRRNQILEFQGKKLGPFQQFYIAVPAPDKSKAFAVGIRNKVLRFASTDGRDVEAVGMPEKLVLTRDGTKAALVCRGNLTLYEGMDINPAAMDMTHMEDVTIYGLDGKKYGPFPKSADFREAWALAESNDWVFAVGKTAYFNGTPLKPFEEGIAKAHFWIDDAAHFAWIESERLKFSDGASFPNPVMLKWAKTGGKTTLSWISILPNRDVVGYSRIL
jgi:hypothetical protein